MSSLKTVYLKKCNEPLIKLVDCTKIHKTIRKYVKTKSFTLNFVLKLELSIHLYRVFTQMTKSISLPFQANIF